MAGFRDKRVTLLIILVVFSGLIVFSPWAPPNDSDAPFPHILRGPNWGMDIVGGSRIWIHLEAKQTQIKFTTPPDNFNELVDLTDKLENSLHTSVMIISTNKDFSRVTLLIGKMVTENMVNSVLKGEGAGISGGTFKNVDFNQNERLRNLRDAVKHSLELRVNPLGTLDARFRSLGSDFILFEVALPLDKAEELLGHTGRVQIFIGDDLALRGDHLKSVGSVSYDASLRGGRGSIYVPFELTVEGAKSFAKASENKGGYPGVIYLDRPEDAILLFSNSFLNRLPSILAYDNEEHKFLYKVVGEHPFHLQVTAVKIGADSIPAKTQDFLENQKNLGKACAILLEGEGEFKENVIKGGNLIVDNKPLLPIETKSRPRDVSATDWIVKRVCKVRSWPIISEDIAGSSVKAKSGLMITTGEDRSEADDLRAILSQRLAVKIRPERREAVDPRLGKKFGVEALEAGLAAFIAVGVLIYMRYRRFKIAAPLLMTMLCEVTITLGLVSLIPATIMTFGLAEMGGLIAVVGTGVDHQVIITDELLTGRALRGGRYPLRRRIARAFSIIFAAAATTIAAMLMLAWLGFGEMRGFAIITIFGVFVSVLVTRPAYARIIGTLLEREQTK